MERQLSTAYAGRPDVVQKALDPTADPVGEADGKSLMASGQKASRPWEDSRRSTTGDPGLTPTKMLSIAKKAEPGRDEQLDNWAELVARGDGKLSPITAPIKAPAPSTGFKRHRRPPTGVGPASKSGLNLALDGIISTSTRVAERY